MDDTIGVVVDAMSSPVLTTDVPEAELEAKGTTRLAESVNIASVATELRRGEVRRGLDLAALDAQRVTSQNANVVLHSATRLTQ